jgi:hypothetical protein
VRLQDLTPKNDPKGGSPRTPNPMPVSDYQSTVAYATNGTIWKMATTFLASGLIGMTVAWWTALQARGMTQADKELLTVQQSSQDKSIGELQGKMDRAFDRLSKIDEKHVAYESQISDIYSKIKLTADYLEEQRRLKR